MNNQISINNNSKQITFTPKLQTLLTKVSTETKEVLIARHTAKTFSEMNNEQLLLSAEMLINELSILTGIKVPLNASYSRFIILTSESLRDDYADLNVPVIMLAFKKYSTVLTIGQDKSFGRILCPNDIHQVLNSFIELKTAADEVEKIVSRETKENQITEEEKENRMRQSIQERFQRGELKCTYADFNQLVRDGLLSEQSCKKVAWEAVMKMKEKYQSIQIFEDPETGKGVVEKRELKEKIALAGEVQDDIKGMIATMYLEWRKQNNNDVYKLV